MRLNLVEAVRDALALALERDPHVVVMGEDVGRNGGVFRATEGLWQRFGGRRVFDTPLAEAAIVGVGLGMAAYGLKPVVEIQFSGFSYLAMNQLAAQAARLHLRSGGRLSAQLVVRAPFGGNVRTPELHSDSLEGLWLHSPGLKVVVPRGPYTAKGLLLAAIEDPDPVVFLEPMRSYRSIREEVPEDYYTLPIGRAEVVRPGDDVTVIAYGAVLVTALEAAELLAAQGVSVEVVDLQTVAPLDHETLVASVAKTGRAVVAHEAAGPGGVAAEVAALLTEHAFYHLEAPIARVTGWETPYPFAEVEECYVPSVERLVAAVRSTLVPA